MVKKYKYQLLLLFVLLIGAIILQFILNDHYNSEEQKQQAELRKRHEETVIKVKAGIDVYATMVSSIRAFIENSTEFPSEEQLQNFLYDLKKETNFKDSMVVSWVDTNQVFQYVVTPYQIDPSGLKGKSVMDLRPKFEIEKLNTLMFEDSISLFDPINLYEGWSAFPFNFSARNSKRKILGYIATVLDVKYLLNYPYKQNDDRFCHSFTISNDFDLTREAVYDGTKNYNKKTDPEYYKNFNRPKSAFVNSTVNFYGLELKIGTAYKVQPKSDFRLALITYIWYVILCLFSLVTLRQYLRNNRLNKQIKLAHSEISTKNQQLQKNFESIQTLLKEVHHRVKNNMQIVTSLMNLQSGALENEESKAIFEETKARIQSMALVHQKLYGNENLTDVNLKQYIEQLLTYVEGILESRIDAPKKLIDVYPSITFNMDTMIPLGLILNELLTNSYKYAFNNLGDKWVKIEFQNRDDQYKLIYSDSGPGIPKEIVPSESGTLGLELIHILTEQLGGKVFYDNSNSSTFTITFKEVIKK